MHLDNVGAVILAGGRATRMGGEDKGLVCLKGKPLVCRAAEKLMPVCAHVVVSANRNLAAYRALGLTVVTDSLENFPGPLAGWLSAMDALTTDYVVSIPCDVPFFRRIWLKNSTRRLLLVRTKPVRPSVRGDFRNPRLR